jgi:hypothetical protein
MAVTRISAAILLAGGIGMALTAVASGKPPFNVADKNADGRVSLDEAKQVGLPKPKAQENDLDDDGYLKPDDWSFIDADAFKNAFKND